MTRNHQTIRTPRRSGVSLVEVSISTLMVGLLLVAAMKSTASAVRARVVNADIGMGELLAQQLMTEILQKKYVDPNSSLVLFGREIEEWLKPRSEWDDVDDYLLWSKSPPQDANGNAIANSTGWTRSVMVYRADPNDLTQNASSDTGIKRIEITMKKGGKTYCKLSALKIEGIDL